MKFRLFLGTLLVGVVLGTVQAANADLISLSIDTPRLMAGQRFAFSIRLHDNGLATPVGIIPELSPRVSIISGPDIVTETTPDDSGRQSRFVYMRYQARANSAGYAELPSIAVRYGVQSLSTKPQLLAVYPDEKALTVPPDLVWQVHADRIYRGQSVLITLDLLHCPSIVYPQNIEVPGLSGGAFEELRGVGTIESDLLAGKEFQRLPVTGFMFTPVMAGTLTLPVARVGIGERTLASPTYSLTVLDLPAGQASGVAIGDFRLIAHLESTEVGVNETVRLVVRVEGTGNLSALNLPEPVFAGLSEVSRNENRKVLATESGYRGYRELVVSLSAPETGSYEIKLPAWPVMDFQGGLRSEQLEPLMLKVVVRAASSGNKQAHAALPYLDLVQLEAFKPSGASPEWKKLLASALAALESRNFQEAAANFSRALKLTPDQPGVLFDLGQTMMELGSGSRGIYYLQLAARLAPWDLRLPAALQAAEQRLHLSNQLAVVFYPPRDFLLIALLVATGLALLLAGLNRWFRSWRWWPVLVVLVGLGAVSLVLLVADSAQRQDLRAVVSDATTIVKRIPDTKARDWLQLPSGTSVRVMARSGEFVQIETPFGIRGWVFQSALFLDESSAGN